MTTSANRGVPKTSAIALPSMAAAEAGVSAGAAVVTDTVDASVGMFPTDAVTDDINTLAPVPEQINRAVELDRLRSEVVYSVASAN